MPPFDSNPFRLLGIAPAIRLDDAAEAKDDAVFDGRLDAGAADRAMRLVGDPRLRLEVELGWPLDAGDLSDPCLPERLTNQPTGSATPDAPLAGMLLLSHAIATGRLKPDAGCVVELAERWRTIQPETITQLINGARTTAGIPVAAPDQVAGALARRRTENARDLLISLGPPENAGKILADAVQRCLARSEPGPFLSDLVQRHNTNSEAALHAIEEEFDHIDRAVRTDPGNASRQLFSLQDALQRWDRISQPVQLLEQYRGHEEERSLALGRRLRGLAVDMTNEHNQPLFSDAVIRSLLETFPELEGLSATLRSDRQTLAPMVAAATRAQATQRHATRGKAAPVAAVRAVTTAQPRPREGGKGWLWGLAAIIVVAFLIYDEDRGSRPSLNRGASGAGTSYSPPVSSPPVSAPSAQTTSPAVAPPAIRQVQMTKPPAGTGRLLGEGEILYCLHRERVIDTVEPRARSGGHLAQFNTLVDDYNARCSNYRYYESAMNSAVRSLDAGGISREAQALMASWNFTSSAAWSDTQTEAAPSQPVPAAGNTGDPLTDALRAAGVPAEQDMPEPANLRDPSMARAAQARLRDLGFLPADGVDGRFGRGSAAALRRFKASRGLPANDVWDYPTQQELFR